MSRYDPNPFDEERIKVNPFADGAAKAKGSRQSSYSRGFKPKLPKAWSSMDWSHGFIRNKELRCENKNNDGFNKLTLLKTPDTTHSWLDQTIGLEECKVKCLDNCY
ncbi:G-type lectin S-receptor-like serine/threonine-protein kinase [Glycine max]|nr:G-type lectin S-receptor-like serine/threonine-protein kinase [Glycine max]